MTTLTPLVTVLAYDTVDDGRRARLAKLLETQGDRVQRSVFELGLDEAALAALLRRVTDERRFDAGVDSLRCYPLCAACRAAARCFGRSAPVLAPQRALVF